MSFRSTTRTPLRLRATKREDFGQDDVGVVQEQLNLPNALVNTSLCVSDA